LRLECHYEIPNWCGAIRNNEKSKREKLDEDIPRISAHKKTVLGSTFLGKRLLLCDGGGANERDDSRISGASL
jgi:hypothetical protein